MPKSLWKGDISFGLVSIPVSLVAAEQHSKLNFHLLDSKDKSRILYQRINAETGKEVPWNQIIKGYEFEKDKYVLLKEEDFQKASPEAFKSIEIQEFVDLKDIDSMYFDKPYYLIPNSKNKKAYVLLREALKKTKKVGVAKVIIRTKEHLSIILPHKNSLVLNLLRFSQEIRSEKELDFPQENLKNYKISDRELKIAIDLIKEMSHAWKPEDFHDEYQESIMKWIKSKIKSGKNTKLSPTKPKEKAEGIIDFMTLLKKSLAEKKSHRGRKHS